MYPWKNILFGYFLCVFTSCVLCNSSPGIPILSKNEITNISNNITVNPSSQTAISTLLNSTSNTIPKNQEIVNESTGRSFMNTHNGREHVIEPPATKQPNSSVISISNETSAKSSNTKSDINLPAAHDIVVPSQHDHSKQSVPKKGVSFPDKEVPLTIPLDNRTSISSTSTIISIHMKKVSNITGTNVSNASTFAKSTVNNTVIHKKPLVTESDSDYIELNGNESNSKDNTISIDQIDPLIADMEKTHSDYLIPIVGVILSVPLVAILISVVYKRGTDWWQHRYYKRMDFLIEGMYHT